MHPGLIVLQHVLQLARPSAHVRLPQTMATTAIHGPMQLPTCGLQNFTRFPHNVTITDLNLSLSL